MKKNNKGFTLVELVLVIAIIGILVAGTISIINPFEIQRSSRDSIRVSTLNSISQALELYYAEFKSYPTSTGIVESSTLNLQLSKYNSRLTYVDPLNCPIRYQKVTDGYILYIPKESTSFKIPDGQNLISIINTPAGYPNCNTFIYTQVFQLYGKQ